MKGIITINSKDLIILLQEKYPYLEIDYIWLDLISTQEYWEQVNNKKLTTSNPRDILDFESTNKKVFRIYNDGSFQEGESLVPSEERSKG